MTKLAMDRLDIVITGGTGALGSAVVAQLMEQGASCHVPCFHLHELERFTPQDHERVYVSPGIDLRSESQVSDFFAQLPGLWASIHIAGGFAMAPIGETTLESFEDMWRMNVVSCFLACREAVKRMRASGGVGEQTGETPVPLVGGGRIVNVAARPALVPSGGMIAYTTAKAGVVSLTQCLADELKGEGIWVNAIAPSIMDTPANRKAMPDADHASWPRLEDVARVIVGLAAPSNALTSGAVVPVYGGA